MVSVKRRILEALAVLRALEMPPAQLNDRTAISLLALLDLSREREWSAAQNPMLGIRAILDFARQKLARPYAENTRESFRKYSVKQMVVAGIVLHNPDKPGREPNSSDNCYQIEPHALALFRTFGREEWAPALAAYLAKRPTLAAQLAAGREAVKLPLKAADGADIKLSPGPHSKLILSIIRDFGPIFVPGGELVYVGATGKKWDFFNAELLASLGISVGEHGKMPDVILYSRRQKWLILVEAVTSSGPVDGIRHHELVQLFNNSQAGLVFVTAFPDKGEIFRRFVSAVAWETEVWCASDPTHLIHFNGTRFLGPYVKQGHTSA